MRHPAVNEIVNDPAAPFQALRAAIKSEMHCALPGVVQAFDPATQTATIQPAIRTRVAKETSVENVQLPLLSNVPVFFPGGGQYALTMPVQQGDECLVVFADSCIDSWWQSGGIQNQIDLRSHDISDGFAFVGFRSRAKALTGVPESVPAVIGEPDALKGPKGDDGKSITNAAFSGNDLVFTLSDNSVVVIPGAMVLLTGPSGSDATVTKAAVELVLTGTIISHNHTKSQITDFPTSMPASDVYPWAKATIKPTYVYSEVGAAAASHTHVKANITDFPASMPASDVYTWAKAAAKPSYTPAEIGALASSSYTAADILAKLLTVDGTGSSLDADMLDGRHATDLKAWAGLQGTSLGTYVAAGTTKYIGIGVADDAWMSAVVMPFTGIVSYLTVFTTGAPGAGKNYTFTLMVDNVATALTCVNTGTATNMVSDTTHKVTVNWSQRLSLRCTFDAGAAAGIVLFALAINTW